MLVGTMEEEVTQDNSAHYDSGSDESDTEDGPTSSSSGNKAGARDSNALLDTWLAELDSLTTVRIFSLSLSLSSKILNYKVMLLGKRKASLRKLANIHNSNVVIESNTRNALD